jgi:hypothetical protein
MSPLLKTKRQANFKDFKRFGAFKGLVEQKNIVFNSFVCKLGFFGTRGPLKRSLRTRQINYYYRNMYVCSLKIYIYFLEKTSLRKVSRTL